MEVEELVEEGDEEPVEEETIEDDNSALLDSKSMSRELRAGVISIFGDLRVCGRFLTLWFGLLGTVVIVLFAED